MTRFSLSPVEFNVSYNGIPDGEAKNYRNKSDVSSDDDNDSSGSSSEDEEMPHPLGFTPRYTNWGSSRYSIDIISSSLPYSSWGSTRFSLDPRGHNILYDDDNDEDDDANDNNNSFISLGSPIKMQSYPPLSCYVDAKTAPTSSLMRFSSASLSNNRRGSGFDDDVRVMDEITEMFSRISTSSSTASSKQLIKLKQQQQEHKNLRQQVQSQMKEIETELQEERISFEKDHRETNRILERLLAECEQRAQELLKLEEDNRKQQEQQQLDLQIQKEQEQEQQKILLQKEREVQLQELKDQQQKEVQQQQQEQQAEQEKVKEEEDKQRKKQQLKAAEEDKQKKKLDYVAKGKKLVAQLVQLRESIVPFDTSKDVSKRRLNMKKIVRGKVNTLSESVEKIKSVAEAVNAAIAEARNDDEQLKQQIQAGANIPPELARGKRYFLDLLASSVIVRAQAEGFNGLRGDGFPLANFLAIIACENKDFVPILTAHIYTVCPMAMPTLPNPKPGLSEDELMESLGIIKDKNGKFETFERFIARTEGIISLVADIMSSIPTNHVLLGGHRGACDWLARFLCLLPPPPNSPLPLLTAPVLDGFLTGAGHMLATHHPEEFKPCLKTIMEDIIFRLDEGSIGQPSATRLKRTVKKGFDGFKDNLPPRALEELYYGANQAEAAATGAPAPTAQKPKVSYKKGYVMPAGGDPGGYGTNAGQNPGGGGGGGNKGGGGGGNKGGGGPSNKDPFGSSKGPSQPSFGSSGNNQVQNPFGGSSNSANTMNSPFGAPSNQQGTSAPNPFGSNTGPSNSGSSFASSMSTPFGGNQQENKTPFDSGNSINSNANSMLDDDTAGGAAPFGKNSFGAQQSNFGGPFGASNVSPFGGSAGSSSNNMGQSAFGMSNNTTAPFGAQPSGAAPFSPSPFGQQSSSMNTPFGNQGKPSPTPFGASSSSPFGGGMTQSRQQTPFGQQQQSTPFGGANQSSSFGAQQNASFGNSGGGSTPFGGGGMQQQSTPFGGGGSGYGNNSNQSYNSRDGGNGSNSFGGNRNSGGKPPCKFFAEGRCRFGESCRFAH